jgi:L-ascorbate metabolism protein UlaG (beta-lactamase superfamily)
MGDRARQVTLTHVGGPTLLLELGGWRLLSDPTFDPAGGHYAFGWGTSSDKEIGPAVRAAELTDLDAILLTHDQHGDNLDLAGRALLPTVPTVLTTRSAARRLGHPDVRGLRAGERSVLGAPGRAPLEVTATPARHGPPLSRPVVGPVVGFLVRCAGLTVWITGDTVLHPPLRRFASRTEVDVLVVHVGGVRFGITGPVRYTLTGRRAMELIDLARPRVAVPVHYEGWSHFVDGPGGLAAAIADAPPEVRARLRRLPIGTPAELATELA